MSPVTRQAFPLFQLAIPLLELRLQRDSWRQLLQAQSLELALSQA